jgi:hypothetical protein
MTTPKDQKLPKLVIRAECVVQRNEDQARRQQEEALRMEWAEFRKLERGDRIWREWEHWAEDHGPFFLEIQKPDRLADVWIQAEGEVGITDDTPGYFLEFWNFFTQTKWREVQEQLRNEGEKIKKRAAEEVARETKRPAQEDIRGRQDRGRKPSLCGTKHHMNG